MQRAAHALCRIIGPAVTPGLCVLVLHLLLAWPGLANSRLKDVADFESVRQNLLVGYGLVVGLNGTGDSLRSSAFTEESLKTMLERRGFSTRGLGLKSKNIGAAIATATLPPFARQGSRVNVSVSALGNAKSLRGGSLLVPPLYGADGEIYAVSQGPITVGGFAVEGAGESVTQGVPTSARIAAGAIVDREGDVALDQLARVRIALRNPDFTTARRVAQAINGHLSLPAARVTDPAPVAREVPASYRGQAAALLTETEQLRAQADPTRVVIDERSGVIVTGARVRISQVAVAQGNLTVRVTETPQASQPNPHAEGDTIVVPRTRIELEERGGNMALLEEGVSLGELVAGLNAVGVGPRDLIGILQAIKAAGALQAEIVVM